ncbi:hypothetical protein QJS10_CPA03g02423 [Acorus calamus]|uniref:Uncharacterized protein n=1 Tax=Acorus calamus TaxID=4465 RepID=A0AAV9F2V6_ACOCL|nr:hypothetical protein QJS10_CPA03g02423 [Acorus calamus]
MCIAAWVWQAHPLYPLLLVLNRDELHDRPTKPTEWWGKECKVLGGRDCLGGGTWLACTKDGRLAFLTNVLELDPLPTAKTRGDLTLRFLEGGKSPWEFAEEVVEEADRYNGFNLIVADLCSKTMVYISNRPKGQPCSVQEVSPGLHVLSNARLDSPWHKALRLGRNFKDQLRKYGEVEVPAKELTEKLMGDTVKANREMLPNTGCDPEWELKLSSIFVDVDTKMGRYGTRSTTMLSLKVGGEVSFYERYIANGIWKEHTVDFQIEKMK